MQIIAVIETDTLSRKIVNVSQIADGSFDFWKDFWPTIFPYQTIELLDDLISAPDQCDRQIWIGWRETLNGMWWDDREYTTDDPDVCLPTVPEDAILAQNKKSN